MRKQQGYIFHRYRSWFVKFHDDVIVDGVVVRKQVCKKLKVEYGGAYRTRKSVQSFVDELLAPINSGEVTPLSTMTVSQFVESTYLPYIKENRAAATEKQYRVVWRNHIQARAGKLTLREFKTVNGQQIISRIADEAGLGASSVKHCKAFLCGCFTRARRLGVLNNANPMQGVEAKSKKKSKKATHAYTMDEIKTMLARLPEPARTVGLMFAWSGFRKSEVWGLRWKDYSGTEIKVERSVWNGIIGEPKTEHSKKPVAVVPELREALDRHRFRQGILAQPEAPIFQAGNGRPLNLDNLARRVIVPAIQRCKVCGKIASAHKTEGHMFDLDAATKWHGWHAFRRGLATNLHFAAHIDDKTVQTIMRHGTLKETTDTYISKAAAPTVSALGALAEQSGNLICNESATSPEQVQ